MAPPNFQKLVEEPFGPYPDSEILSPDWEPNAKDLPRLSSLWMDCDGTSIGFDESEFLAAPQSGRIVDHPVRFFGALEIKSLTWLSLLGQKWLETDLRQRDVERHLNFQPNPVSGLTLKRLYGDRDGEGSKIKVWIQGEKILSALYLTAKSHPTSLLLQSKNRHRKYDIASLDVETYEKSRKFLSRYQLLALMKAIISSDPDNTALGNRDIDYFVDGYLARFRQRELFHRYIFDAQNDPDVDEDGETSSPRHLRHVPRAEVISIFAAQSDWILAYNLLLSNRDKLLVDIAKWHKFCRQVKQARRDARLNGVRRWGLRHGIDSDEEDNESNVDLTEFWLPDHAKKRLRDATGKKRKMKEKKPKRRIDTTPISEEDTGPRQLRVQHHYDPDFSPPSTPPASDSDTDPSPDPEFASLIPTCCWEVPEMPEGRLSWHCPVSNCPYTIDLLSLTNENIDGLDRSIVKFLTEKLWKSVKDERVQAAFLDMASNHYKEHLRRLGIRLIPQSPTKYSIGWEQPNRHRPWPPPELPGYDGGGPTTVKQEEDDILMDPSRMRNVRGRLVRREASQGNATASSSRTLGHYRTR